MPLAEVRRVAADALDRLDLPTGLTLETLRTIIEDDRGKSIVIQPAASLGGDQVSGLWLSTPDTVLILHAETGSAIHSQQIILHELAHMILGHDELMQDGDFTASLLPDLSADLVTKALARCEHLDDIEVAAETLADMLASRLSTSRRLQQAEPHNFQGVFG
jgi:hypothetical protein